MTSDRESGGDDDEFYEPDDIAELHQGIVNNDLDLLRQVLESGVSPNEKFPADVNPQHDGMTPLALASALNKVEAVKLLLTYQANVNDSFASLKTTALMTSSFHGHSEIVRILLRKGADVRAVDLQGSTALGYAFGGARTIEVIHQLLKAGIDVNQKNMLGMNALLLVAGYGNDVLAKMILDAGADANSTNDFGHSALHLTVVGKRSQIKKLMSGQTGSYGLNRRNIDVALKEWARLHRDTLRGQDNELELEKVGEFMMSIGSKLDERDYISDDDNEAMKRRVEAVWRHRQDKIQAGKEKKKPGVLDNFLSCGGKRGKQAKHGLKSPTAKPFDSQDNYPGRAINSPDADRDVNQISESCSKILRMIIDSGCEIDKMEKTFGMTALDMAILLGDVESTAILVAAGGDSNHLMKMFALTDLYESLVQLDKKQVKELLTFDSDIDVNQPFSQFNITKRRGNGGETDQLKSDGVTPLTVAAQLNEVEVLDIMKLLQKQGADVNKVGPGGSCPLGEACRTGNLKMVQFLVSQGADIETRCPAYKDATPVTIAAMSGHRLIVEFLLAKDAKIDKPMSDGRSALIRAVENSDWEMVEQIFNANLHDNFFDHNNFSYDMAERYQRPDRDFDTLKRAITDEARQFADRDREESMQKNKAGRLPGSVGPMGPMGPVVGQQNQRRQTSLDDPVPPSHGRMGRVPEVPVIQEQQQRQQQQKQQFRQHPPKPPSPEESSDEEEEDDEEEEEQQQQQRLRQQQQQKPKQVQQQQKQQKQQKQHNPPAQPPPVRPPPPPTESSSEEEDDDEEEEFSNRQQLHQPKQQQQQPKQQQQQQPKQQQQQPKQQQQQPKQQQQQPKQQQQMKEQQVKKPLPPERTSSEEEDDEEEEVRKPQQQQQQRHPPAGKSVAPAAKIPQKKPESSEEEDDDDDDEDEDDEEEEVKPVPPVQVKKQVVPQMPVARPPGNQAANAKPVQKQPSSEEEEETDEEEEESEEEEVRAPPQKTTPANILPSAKFENRTFQAMPNHSAAATKGSPARPNNVQAAKQNSSTPNRAPGPPAAASVKSPMSPSGPPPPLPSTGPPSDTPTESEEDESEEEDEDFERNRAPVVTKNNNKISSPSKNKVGSSQSTVTTTKGSGGGVTTRTVVTKTVVTSNVTSRNEPAKGRPNAAKVEVSDDDDEDEDDDDDEDEEEESDDDNGRARYHSTETDI